MIPPRRPDRPGANYRKPGDGAGSASDSTEGAAPGADAAGGKAADDRIDDALEFLAEARWELWGDYITARCGHDIRFSDAEKRDVAENALRRLADLGDSHAAMMLAIRKRDAKESPTLPPVTSFPSMLRSAQKRKQSSIEEKKPMRKKRAVQTHPPMPVAAEILTAMNFLLEQKRSSRPETSISKLKHLAERSGEAPMGYVSEASMKIAVELLGLANVGSMVAIKIPKTKGGKPS